MAECPSCASQVGEQNRFCPSCGVALSDSFATQTVAVTPSPRRAPSSAARTAMRTSSSRVHEGRFAPGALLAGRYRIVSLLGKGGMGEVYRADDLALDQQVALKFLPEVLAENPEAIARFRNEVRTARQVSHPNVCRVYDLTEVEGTYVLSMEYVDGEDLGSLLRRIGRLPADKALEIARKLCAGLAAAHEKGVLHRDLKPANVMLDGRGQVLLTDFGLAGLAGEIEGSEVRNGTPAYMAPEQLAGLEVTVKSDLYALGLVLYELFTGKLPFEADTLAGLLRARAENTPMNPSTLVRDLDPAVEKVILRCLQSKPSLRPASALAVAAALPGGDRLAAALAAGETPSPEMVAEAGEGQGLSLRAASILLAATLIAFAGCGWFALRRGAIERMQPPYAPEVLTQKVRDLLKGLGYNGNPVDSFARFQWNDPYINQVSPKGDPQKAWRDVLAGEPSPLQFWYRQADSELFAGTFHDDWLTPGMVDATDPAPTEAGMAHVVVDGHGHLLQFEAMPKQKLPESKAPAPAPDWTPLFAAAGLDAAQLKPADPQWTWLASSDTRAAWTGTWPGSSTPLRVEAAALRGRPVAFMLLGSWASPWREPGSGSTPAVIILLAVLVVVILVVGPWLARRNWKQNRGDRRGATRLAIFVFCVQMALWLMRAHFSGPMAAFGLFLVALATSLFYAAVLWMVYLAMEPYVRRRWPQTLISWTSALGGGMKDAIVGRDVLIGAAMGACFSIVDVVLNTALPSERYKPIFASTASLNGLRATLGSMLVQVPQGIRGAVIFVFLIFLLRVLFRNQWLAGFGFAMFFASLNFLQNGNNWSAGLAALLLYGLIAVVMLRWGLLAVCAGIFVTNVAGVVALTSHAGQWYFGNTLLMVGVVLGLTVWGAWTSLGGRKILKADWFE